MARFEVRATDEMGHKIPPEIVRVRELDEDCHGEAVSGLLREPVSLEAAARVMTAAVAFLEAARSLPVTHASVAEDIAELDAVLEEVTHL